jgi:hypothetical protein
MRIESISESFGSSNLVTNTVTFQRYEALDDGQKGRNA